MFVMCIWKNQQKIAKLAKVLYDLQERNIREQMCSFSLLFGFHVVKCLSDSAVRYSGAVDAHYCTYNQLQENMHTINPEHMVLPTAQHESMGMNSGDTASNKHIHYIFLEEGISWIF